MTKNRDLKDMIRERMRKTGESYTAARASFLGPQAKHVAPPSEWASLAGMRDEAVAKKTGKTWQQWVDALDKKRLFEHDHKTIAKRLEADYDDVNGWWAQSITVGYERIHGIREVRQNCAGGYDANKSKTFKAPVEDVFAAFVEDPSWLEGATQVRNVHANKSLILDWDDGTQVNVFFTAKSEKCAVSLQHKRLEGQDDIDHRKAFWTVKLGELAQQVGA